MGVFLSLSLFFPIVLLLSLSAPSPPASRLKAILREQKLVYPWLCLTNHFHYKALGTNKETEANF